MLPLISLSGNWERMPDMASHDRKRKTLALAHYIDDSGSHDDSKLVVMGGPILPQRDSYSHQRSGKNQTNPSRIP